MKNYQIIHDNILSNTSDGVVVIQFDGRIKSANEAALKILEMQEEELVGRAFARCFLGEGEPNEDLVQSMLDAIYSRSYRQESYVPYYVKGKAKQLRVISTYLKEGEYPVGATLLITDITQIVEMQETIKTAEQVKAANQKLAHRNQILRGAFDRYLTDNIAREILETPDGMKMGGRREHLTVMMTDLRGFTMLCQQMEPQALITMLNYYFEEMGQIISRYGGNVLEFMGDGMLIIFGAPNKLEHHAAAAVAAAICMQMQMDEINRWNQERGYAQLSMGVGINTGEVILGNIGSSVHTKYGIIGAPVNLAGRIESYTTGGEILISPSTLEEVGEDLVIDHQIRVMPKGVQGEIVLSSVTGIGGAYNLHLAEESDQAVWLSRPEPIRFSQLDGKHVGDTAFSGNILAISQKYALLETSQPLGLYENLLMDIGEDLYAKVLAHGEDSYKLCFTAKPTRFAQWKEELLSKG